MKRWLICAQKKKEGGEKEVEDCVQSVCVSEGAHLVTEDSDMDNVFEILQIVDPKTAQEFSLNTIAHVLQRFPILNSFADSQTLDSEWKRHALLNFDEEGLDCSRPAVKYWTDVFHIKNANGDFIFPNLKTVFNLLFILPFSNAPVERVFSVLNDCKRSERNRLATDTIVALMGAREGIKESGSCIKFEPNNTMMRRNIWQ